MSHSNPQPSSSTVNGDVNGNADDDDSQESHGSNQGSG
jgi:hypothetical protein